jgi:hypothetical protein
MADLLHQRIQLGLAAGADDDAGSFPANRMALARPIPELAPVMMATLLDSNDMAVPSRDVHGARWRRSCRVGRQVDGFNPLLVQTSFGSTLLWFKALGGRKHCWFESTMAANLCHDDPDLAHLCHRRWLITASGDIRVL